ncbi:uncharacterized protein B0J16DRAFT_293380 [Fusarium flagelliforme]|uniref:uncharacterized protein n=1 Tax=Fusarium flagelliforme TaxID=2675880 RepID=UPI001E8EBEAE|nr:uncharacterized protein B0J16DRAFT_293380 [Fusarium flagelliforme]KAH7173304.1 hypothetical protein B0J16DRAFT_293380 [Fusarium flagelliforme]
MLMLLPPEILEHICEKLHGTDLKSLSQASKYLHQTTHRRLWRSVTIQPPSPTNRHSISSSGPPQQCLKPTRALHFHIDDAKHCVHAHDWLGYIGNWSQKDPQLHDTWEGRSDSFGLGNGRLVRVKYECLVQRALVLLGRFEEGQLETFSWSYMTCIPSEVIQHLSLKHPSIQSLNFTTDPFCSRFNRWSRNTDINLSAFHNIRRFIWKAPMGRHFGNISTLVQTNASHLEELELDLQCWSRRWENREMRVVRLGDRWDKVPANTMLARQIFGLGVDADMDMCFPKMKSLKLTRVPLQDEITGKAVSPACINFSNLTYLTLNMCPYWTTLLATLNQSRTSINLKSFEILDFYLQTPHETAVRKTSIITDFLDSFNKLEELYISYCGPTSVLKFWEHLAGHTSLKSFVHHQRVADRDDEMVGVRMGSDLMGLGMDECELKKVREDPGMNSLWRLDLQFLGSTCAPKYLKDVLLPFVRKRSLKVLHIRHTGVTIDCSPSWIFDKGQTENAASTASNEDVNNEMSATLKQGQIPPLQRSFRLFADWIFSPEGVTSLEYIVAGDLSHGSRYAENNVLVCRERERYRVIGHKDGGEEWRDVKRRFGRALGACPVENIIPEYN